MESPPKPKRRRWQYSLRTLLILSLISGCAMMWWFGRYGRWAAELADEKKRDAALFNLLQAQRYRDNPHYKEDPEPTQSGCKVNHVLVSRPLHGETIYVVFKVSTYKDEETGPGIPKGHVMAFDSQGYFVPWFDAANVMNGEMFCPEKDGPLHAIDVMMCGVSPVSVAELYIVPMTLEMKPALLVAFDRAKDEPGWGWRVQSVGNTTEIQLGPKAANGSIEPVVHYVWSKAQQRYVGPEGGVDEHFMRLEFGKEWKQMEAFAAKATKEKP